MAEKERRGEREKERRRRGRNRDGVFPQLIDSSVCVFVSLSVCVCGSFCLIMCVCVWSVCVSSQLSDTMIFCNHLGEYKKDELLEAAR